MLKLALCSLVFGGYALASGGGGDGTPPVYYKYTYECSKPGKDFKVTMTTLDQGWFVPFSQITVKGINGEIDTSIQMNRSMRFYVANRYQEIQNKLPSSISNGDFTLRETHDTKRVEGTLQYRDAKHHIELYSSKEGRESTSIEVFVYDLHTEALIFDETLRCNLKIENHEG